MPVTIRKMTRQEFEVFRQRSVQHHTAELMEERDIPYEEAVREAEEELSGMLPNGLHTESNFLMSIVSDDEIVGFIWTLREETAGKQQCFLCDFAVWEGKRRRGYGETALHLAEGEAANAGCAESVLFVADSNAAARALYEKCGYQFLRQSRYGRYMIKELKTGL